MPQVHEIIVSFEAEKNIEAAVGWIAQADPSAALAWYEGLINALESLAYMPHRYPLSPETRLGLVDGEIRQLLYGRNFWKYRILFKVNKRRVLIAHIRHGARLYLGQQQDDPGD